MSNKPRLIETEIVNCLSFKEMTAKQISELIGRSHNCTCDVLKEMVSFGDAFVSGIYQEPKKKKIKLYKLNMANREPSIEEQMILKELENNELTNRQISEKTGIFIHTVENFTQKLKRKGLIKVVGKDEINQKKRGQNLAYIFAVNNDDDDKAVVVKKGFIPIPHKPQTWYSLLTQ